MSTAIKKTRKIDPTKVKIDKHLSKKVHVNTEIDTGETEEYLSRDEDIDTDDSMLPEMTHLNILEKSRRASERMQNDKSCYGRLNIIWMNFAYYYIQYAVPLIKYSIVIAVTLLAQLASFRGYHGDLLLSIGIGYLAGLLASIIIYLLWILESQYISVYDDLITRNSIFIYSPTDLSMFSLVLAFLYTIVWLVSVILLIVTEYQCKEEYRLCHYIIEYMPVLDDGYDPDFVPNPNKGRFLNVDSDANYTKGYNETIYNSHDFFDTTLGVIVLTVMTLATLGIAFICLYLAIARYEKLQGNDNSVLPIKPNPYHVMQQTLAVDNEDGDEDEVVSQEEIVQTVSIGTTGQDINVKYYV